MINHLEVKFLLDQKQYEAYYEVFKKILSKYFNKGDMIVVSEILNLCRERNYFIRYKNGDKNRSIKLKLSPKTINELSRIGFIKTLSDKEKSNLVNMSIDPVVAKQMENFVDNHPKIKLLDLTQFLMLYSGKFLMKPDYVSSNYQKLANLAPEKTKDKDWDKTIENWLIS